MTPPLQAPRARIRKPKAVPYRREHSPGGEGARGLRDGERRGNRQETKGELCLGGGGAGGGSRCTQILGCSVAASWCQGVGVGGRLVSGGAGDSAENRSLPRLAPAALAATRGRGKLGRRAEGSRQHVLLGTGTGAQWREENGAGRALGGPAGSPPGW